MTSRQERFEEMRQQVVDAGGILETTVLALRLADGSGSAKYRVVARIEHELRKRNLLWLPARLPRDQDATVYLYSPQTDAGQLLATALRLADLDRLPRAERQVA